MTITVEIPDRVVAALERISGALEALNVPQSNAAPTEMPTMAQPEPATYALLAAPVQYPTVPEPAEAEPAAQPEPAPAGVADNPNFDHKTVILEAIAHKRAELIGLTWQTDRDTDLYKKWYTPISVAAKQIAVAISGGKASKPSELEPGLTQNFVTAMAELHPDENGKLISIIPF